MEGDVDPAGEPMGRGDARRAAIHAAAIEQFSERGFAATSMANIAAAAGVSRPALYQYFEDKNDIFASAFVALFAELADDAIEALNRSGSTADRLDGFLQRYEGDLWQHMAASPHLDEIATVKDETVTAAVSEIIDRLWSGMADFLEVAGPGKRSDKVARRADWLVILRLSPKGFRSDGPSVETYRHRLTALARSVAAEIDGL